MSDDDIVEQFKSVKLPKVQKVTPQTIPAEEVEVNPPKGETLPCIRDLAAVQPIADGCGEVFRMRKTVTMAKDAPPEPQAPWYGREAAGFPKDHQLFGMSVVEVMPEEIKRHHLDSIRYDNEWKRFYHEEDHPPGARPEPRPVELWEPLAEFLESYEEMRAENIQPRLYWFRSSPESFMQLAGREGYAIEHSGTVDCLFTVIS